VTTTPVEMRPRYSSGEHEGRISEKVLRVRWLGKVPYREADVVQRALHERTDDDYLLLLEHPHVFTFGTRATPEHVLVPPARVGAELVHSDRGGDVTYHGPGQLVGYPIVTLPEGRAGMRDVVAYVRALEDVMIAALADFGIAAGRVDRYTGVWVGDEKVAAIGVRVARGRTRHGFALNVEPDLEMFEHIVPCGIDDRGVTSMGRLLGAAPEMSDVVDRVSARFAEHFGFDAVDEQRVASHKVATDDATPVTFRRPSWMKVKANLGGEYRELKQLVKGLELHTVCEEAGCPNIYECWSDRTATFMILGDRCTRACGFCLVDTRKPRALDVEEPARVAEAVARLGLAHAVITSVARDDVADGGAAIFAATIRAIRARTPGTAVEVLIPDCKGDGNALDAIFAARPDVLNHNLETVARLQRTARPSASYARSLGVLARAKSAGLTTKSGLILGMGETDAEVRAAVADLHNVGVDILTIGQYLRPSAAHLPVSRWWTPDEFAAVGRYAESLRFAHVESGPLVRSSYHARQAATVAETASVVSKAV
jgi:lipoyl synthase